MYTIIMLIINYICSYSIEVNYIPTKCNLVLLHLYVAVLVRPTLIFTPRNITVEENGVAHFECNFITSMQEHLVIIEWLKDGLDISSTSSKHLVVEGRDPQDKTLIFSMLKITGVSKDDEGIYSCSCYYNTTTLDSLYIDMPPIPAQGLATLELIMSQGT